MVQSLIGGVLLRKLMTEAGAAVAHCARTSERPLPAEVDRELGPRRSDVPGGASSTRSDLNGCLRAPAKLGKVWAVVLAATPRPLCLTAYRTPFDDAYT